MTALPPRSQALAEDRMIVSFDLDCGELVPGHRFVGRGVADCGLMPPFDGRQAVPGISLEYELVPGVPPLDNPAEFFSFLVGVEYTADVELPWEPNDGGAIAPYEGGPSTHGSRGDWPLPEDARRLTFTLFPVDASGSQRPDPAGAIEVDLVERTAAWRSF
jgi:hypothetical protein